MTISKRDDCEAKPRETPVALVAGIAVCAVVAGTFVRFKGLGSAPLAVDEYFIVRSTQNILHHGWPEFDCGGYYTRGLLLQYLSALLTLLGAAVDTSPRILCAMSSLCALPAAFILGRRTHGSTVGWLVVAVLSLSVWEVEMARFGRMYAPFQMVFLWYLVFFLKFTIDRDARAVWVMAVLTIVGSLLWEGGVFLALANFLPLFMRRSSTALPRRIWPYLAISAALLALVYWFETTDFRVLGDSPPLPRDYDPSLTSESMDLLQAPLPAWMTLAAHPVWLAGFLPVLVVCGLSLRWIWSLRDRVFAAVGLLAVLGAALIHQFLAVAVLLALVVLVRALSWRELLSRDARLLYAALTACALFWIACLGSTWQAPAGLGAARDTLVFAYQFVSLPDLVGEVFRPWSGAIPITGAGLALVLGIGLWRVIKQDESGLSAQRALWVVFLCLLIAASASHPPRHETRYVFFLYPIALILALSTVAAIVETLSFARHAATAMTIALGLGAFSLTDDFKPRHLLEIDNPRTLFRLGLTPSQQSHLVVRDDTRAVAHWLRQHEAGDADVVITAVQGLQFYDSRINFFYVARNDYNFASYACRRGAIDRWSNLPLLQSPAAVDAAITASHRTFLVTFSDHLAALLPQLLLHHPSVVSTIGNLSIVAFEGGSAQHTPAT